VIVDAMVGGSIVGVLVAGEVEDIVVDVIIVVVVKGVVSFPIVGVLSTIKLKLCK